MDREQLEQIKQDHQNGSKLTPGEIDALIRQAEKGIKYQEEIDRVKEQMEIDRVKEQIRRLPGR